MNRAVLGVLVALAVTGCASSSPVASAGTEANLAAAKKLYGDFLRGDIDAVLAAMSDDVTWVIPGPAALPYSGTKHGKTEWKNYLSGLGATDIVSFQPKEYLATGNEVVVLGHETLKVKATGKVMDGDFAQVLTFENGRLVRFQSFDDTAAAVAAFSPAP